MGKVIAFVVGAFGAVLLVRYLIECAVVLPARLLPQDSLFQFSHYRQWQESAFPAEVLSAYGRTLQRQLMYGHGLAGLEWAILLLLAVVGGKEIEKRRRKGNA